MPGRVTPHQELHSPGVANTARTRELGSGVKAWLARNEVVLHTPASDTLALLFRIFATSHSGNHDPTTKEGERVARRVPQIQLALGNRAKEF